MRTLTTKAPQAKNRIWDAVHHNKQKGIYSYIQSAMSAHTYIYTHACT